MLTYRVGAGGKGSSAAGMAQYYQSSEHVPELQRTMAGYYSDGTSTPEVGALVIPNAAMHPLIAERLGIDPSRPMATDELAGLLNGTRADGEAIAGKKASKNSYIDLTFSAPKSFSVALVLSPTDNERRALDKAHVDAVDSVMAYISKEIGTASIGDNTGNRSLQRKREQAHIALIRVDHYTARPTYKLGVGDDTKLIPLSAGDPQRHSHVLVPNVAVTNAGRITSLHQDGLGQRIHEWGSLYQAFLATNLRKLGVNVELDSTQGLTFNERMARLTDIPRKVSEMYSKRTTNGDQVARDAAKAAGLVFDEMSPEAKAEMLGKSVNKTRKAKEAGGGEYAAWIKQADDAGYKHRSVLRPGSEQELRPQVERHQRAHQITLPLIAEQFTRRAVIEGSVPRVAAAKALIETGVESAAEISVITAAHRTEGVEQDGRTTAVHWAFDTEKKYARVTTQLSVEMEQEAVDLLRVAAADKSVSLSPEAIQRAVDRVSAAKKLDFTSGHGLKQRELIDKVGSAGRAMVWVGVAGSGKSTALQVPVSAWHEMGRDTFGITLAWRQTEGLKDAGVGRHTKKKRWEPVKDGLVDAGIAADRTFALEPFLKGVEKGKIVPTSNSTVIIDELGLVGTTQLLRLARLQKQHGFQLIGLGDDLQCQSIEAGASVDLARRAFGAENVPELLSTIRQETKRDRDTAMMFRSGNADGALSRKDEDGTLRIIPGGYADAVKATVDLWWERTEANATNPLYTLGVSVPTNADGRAIGEAIRERLKAVGRVGRDICQISATDQNGALYIMNLAAGDRVRLFNRVRAPDKDVIGNNGSVVTVLSADKDGMRVRNDRGKESGIGWDALRKNGGPVRLAPGYAVTIDARQSDTVTEHITSMPAGSSAVNGFNIYTADSRHRTRSWIITSQGAEKQELANRRSLGDPANDEADPATVKAAVLENIARNLSRQPKKTLALDFLDHSKGLRSGTVDAKKAAWTRPEVKPEVIEPVREAPKSAPLAEKPPAPMDDPDAWRQTLPQETPAPSPPKDHPHQMSATEVQSEFAHALEREGFRLKGAPVMDGKWHRVAIDGDKGAKKSGSYRGWDTGGIMNNFRGGEPITWRPEQTVSPISAEDRQRQATEARDARQQAETERKANEERVAKDAVTAWQTARPAHPQHAYLQRKGIPPIGLRMGAKGQTVPMTEGKEMRLGGKLLVPLRDESGKLWNVQVISPSGDKIFLPGRKKGLSATVGTMDNAGPILIAEGYATAATLHNTTSLTSVAAIDSGNLLTVAAGIRSRYPERPIIFAADNDHHLPRRENPLPNVGVEKATEAAAHVGGVVVTPVFAADDKSTDWNDVAVTKGSVVARAEIAAAFKGQGILELLPPAPSAPQVTQAERDAAWALAPEQTAKTSAAARAAEVQRPNHTQGV